MTIPAKTVLILGSAPNVLAARELPRAMFSEIVAINNAWSVRPDWDYHISPEDFPADRAPDPVGPGQHLIGAADYVPANNAYGGIVYAGATMAFSTGYWALAALRPTLMVFLGCDMVYGPPGAAHFYGTGTADPLRDDITLRSLEAKSARLMYFAAAQGCACVRASNGASRLVFPSVDLDTAAIENAEPAHFDEPIATRAQQHEADLGYVVESGRYWDHDGHFDAKALDRIDEMWMNAAGLTVPKSAAAG